MKKKLTQDQIRALQANGAKVHIIAKEKPGPDPRQAEVVPAPMPTVAELAMAQMAANVGSGQKELIAHLQKMLECNESKPTAFRFTITRNKKGLIETIDAHPIV